MSIPNGNYSSMQLLAWLCIVVFSLLQNSCFALKKSYIVYMGSHSHGPEVTTAQLNAVTDSHHEFLASFLGSKEKARESIFYSYKRHINGFAATLDEEDVEEIKNHPDVVSVFENKRRELYTTYSWDFLKLEQNNGLILSNSLWRKSAFGEDIVIANFDSGAWPESKSFSDEGYGPIPSKWKGQCHRDAGIRCNRKLIGARFYNKGYLSVGGIINSTVNNARDYEGHGTHTLSIAGGNFVEGAHVFGAANGTAKGGAPRARLAIYKVCWPECEETDLLKAFDMAIHDRVDVISISLGGFSRYYFHDVVSIGAFHAARNGIAVVCAAGNEGPDPSSVSNVAPWILTVGATTTDRTFATFVLLQNGRRLQGSSVTKALPEDRFYPLIAAAQAKASNATIEDASHCLPGTLDPVKVKGKILVCIRSDKTYRMETGRRAFLAGAVGMILCNDESYLNDVPSDSHFLPAAHLNYSDSLVVFDYINSTSDPVGYITPSKPIYGTKRAPMLADFSSRGPNTITQEILKPDITAPGVGIIAAFSEATSPEDNDDRRTPYAIEQGTSMACPHVAGVVALLKSIRPHWSFAAIKSAIMTTAITRDNRRSEMMDGSSSKEDIKATPFGYGAGNIRPNLAADPGLVYDLTTNDYLDFLCGIGYNKTLMSQYSDSYKCPYNAEAKAIGTNSSTLVLNFNYPSITVPNIKAGSLVTVTRRLKNVGRPGKYHVRLRQPRGFLVSVHPTSLTFNEYSEVKTFQLTVKVRNDNNSSRPPAANIYYFGELIWSNKIHYVRSPIVVSAA